MATSLGNLPLELLLALANTSGRNPLPEALKGGGFVEWGVTLRVQKQSSASRMRFENRARMRLKVRPDPR
jgi:hypothetical protein